MIFREYPELRIWCQKVLPLTYDDSLSYYEVLCRLMKYINNMSKDIAQIPDYILSLITNGTDVSFTDVDSMKDADLTPGFIVKTLGYYTPNDYGGMFYLIKSSNDGYGIQLDNGNYANPIFMDDYVTPQMFGARANGTTDDASVIATALTTGRPVNLVGNYGVGSSIVLPVGQKLYSINGGKLTKLAEEFATVQCHGDNTVTGITIVGTQYQTQSRYNTNYAIECYEADNCLIENNKLYKCDFTGIHVVNSDHVVVSKNLIDTYGYAGIMCRYSCNDIKIVDNSIINGVGVSWPNRYGIIIGTGDSTDNTYKSRGVVCSRNYIEDTTPYWEGIDAHGAEECIVSENIIINTLSAIAFTQGNTVRTHERCIITGNVIKLTVPTNKVASTGGIAILGASNIVVSNNEIKVTADNIGTTDKYGIKISGLNLIIENNVCELPHVGSWRGMYTQSNSQSPCLGCLVKNNIFDTDYFGVQVTNSSYRTSIKGDGNVFRNCSYGCYFIMQPDEDNKVYRSPVFFKNNTFENCSNKCSSNSRGGFIDFWDQTSGAGISGDIIYNDAYDGTNTFCWLCTASFDNDNQATWVAVSSGS